MRRRSGEWLFGEAATIHDVVHAQRESLDKALAAVTATELGTKSLDELSNEIVHRLRLEAPTLDRSQTTQLPVEEVDLDVSQDPMRGFIDRRRPFHIKATQLAIAVPFSGEAALFKYGTSQFNSPHPGEVVGNTLVLRYVGDRPDPEVVRREFEQRLTGIESTLQMVRGHCDSWNEELAKAVPQRLAGRLAKIKKDQSLDLGFPVAAAVQPTPQSAAPRAKAADRYELFLSHASEDKASIARPLYEGLTRAGVSVWFDEAVLQLGDSLRRKIDEGLSRCRFGVVILSPHFFEKQWPQRELDGLVARETSSGQKAVLPIWHEVDRDDVLRYSPPLADRFAGRSTDGIGRLVAMILETLGHE